MEKYAVTKSIGQIAIYQANDGQVQLEVALEQGTEWLISSPDDRAIWA